MTDDEEKPSFVVFATPTLGRSFALEYLMSAMATQHACYAAGINQVWKAVGGDPYLPKVRSRMVSDFLRFPDATDLFFLDDDMGWPAEKVIEFLRRPEDIVVGAYPQKVEGDAQYPIELEGDGHGGIVLGETGLLRTLLAPTGFMRIKRRVIEAMAADSGRFMDAAGDQPGGEVQCFDIFRAGFVEYSDKPGEGKWWGEDFFFCSRWRAMGGEIWCDPDIPFTHRGGKVWSGNFRDVLMNRGLLEPVEPIRGVAA